MPLEITIDCTACHERQSVTIANPETERVVCFRCGADLCHLRKITGYLYILSNPRMPGILKIGLTARTVAARVAELNSATGVYRRPAEMGKQDPTVTPRRPPVSERLVERQKTESTSVAIVEMPSLHQRLLVNAGFVLEMQTSRRINV